MVRQDIVAGIKNAIERGYSMEQAKQTMLNSGYKTGDINEAASYLTGGLGTQIVQNVETKQQYENPSQQMQQSQEQQVQQLPTQNHDEEPKKKSSGMIILLVILLLSLVGILAISIFFREDLISFFSGLF